MTLNSNNGQLTSADSQSAGQACVATASQQDIGIAQFVQQDDPGEKVQAYRRRPKRSAVDKATSSAGATFMFINSCLGGSLLSLGYRFSSLGLPLALVYILCTFTFEIIGFRYIIQACHFGNISSLQKMIQQLYNRKIALVVDVATVLMLFGVLIAFTIIGAEYGQQFYNLLAKVECGADNQKQCDRIYMYCELIVGAVFILLSCISSIELLNTVSSVSMVFAVFTIICVVVRGCQMFATKKLPGFTNFQMRVPAAPYKPQSAKAVISNLPPMFSLFSLQSSIPPFYGDIRGSKSQKLRVLTVASDAATGIVFVLYLIFGVFGSLMFYGDNQQQQKQNLLSNFADTDILMTVVRIGYGVVIIVAYPCVLYPVKAALSGWFKIDRAARKGKALYLVCGVCTTLLVIGGSLLIPNIVVAFDVFAAIFGVVLYQLIPLGVMYKLPALKERYLRESHEEQDELTNPDGAITVIGKMMRASFGGQQNAARDAACAVMQELNDESNNPPTDAALLHIEETSTAGPRQEINSAFRPKIGSTVGFGITAVLMCCWGIASFVFVCIDLARK